VLKWCLSSLPSGSLFWRKKQGETGSSTILIDAVVVDLLHRHHTRAIGVLVMCTVGKNPSCVSFFTILATTAAAPGLDRLPEEVAARC
jgi:hypothetical protein